MVPQTVRSSYWDLLNGQTYGRWCGGIRSGFKDCCSGRACGSCAAGSQIADGQIYPSTACLQECPPQDAMDRACAAHDTCLRWPSALANSRDGMCAFDAPSFDFQNGLDISEVNHACLFCDARLVRDVRAVDPNNLPFQWGYGNTYHATLLSAFSGVQCWSFDRLGATKQCYDGPGSDPSVWKTQQVTKLANSGGTTSCYVSARCNDECGAASGLPGTQCLASGACTSSTGWDFPYACVPVPAAAACSGGGRGGRVQLQGGAGAGVLRLLLPLSRAVQSAAVYDSGVHMRRRQLQQWPRHVGRAQTAPPATASAASSAGSPAAAATTTARAIGRIGCRTVRACVRRHAPGQ